MYMSHTSLMLKFQNSHGEKTLMTNLGLSDWLSSWLRLTTTSCTRGSCGHVRTALSIIAINQSRRAENKPPQDLSLKNGYFHSKG